MSFFHKKKCHKTFGPVTNILLAQKKNLGQPPHFRHCGGTKNLPVGRNENCWYSGSIFIMFDWSDRKYTGHRPADSSNPALFFNQFVCFSRLVTNNQQVMLDMMPVLILSQHNQQQPQLQDTARRHHMDRPLVYKLAFLYLLLLILAYS